MCKTYLLDDIVDGWVGMLEVSCEELMDRVSNEDGSCEAEKDWGQSCGLAFC